MSFNQQQQYGQTPLEIARNATLIAAQQQQQLGIAQQQQLLAQQQQQQMPVAAVSGTVSKTTAVRTSDFEDHTTNEYYLKLEGSLNDLHNNKLKATIKVAKGAEHIYQRIGGRLEDGSTVYEGDVAKGVIMGLRLGVARSNFPCDIGLNFPGVIGTTKTMDGHTYAAIIPANETTDFKSKCVYKAVDPITLQALEEYSDSNLEKLKTTYARVADNIHSTINNNSIIGQVLHKNKATLQLEGLPVDPKENVQLYLPNEIIDACVACIEEASRVPFQDMRTFAAKFSRVGEVAWNSPAGIIDNIKANSRGDGGHVSDKRMERIHTLIIPIEMDLNLIGKGQPTTVPAVSGPNPGRAIIY